MLDVKFQLCTTSTLRATSIGARTRLRTGAWTTQNASNATCKRGKLHFSMRTITWVCAPFDLTTSIFGIFTFLSILLQALVKCIPLTPTLWKQGVKRVTDAHLVSKTWLQCVYLCFLMRRTRWWCRICGNVTARACSAQAQGAQPDSAYYRVKSDDAAL